GGVPRQPRGLEAHHDARAPEADVSHELLEAVPALHRGAGLPLVAVDDDDLLGGPAERHGALPQGVLPLRALRVLEHLPERRLSDVEVRVALEVPRRDLLVGLAAQHDGLPSCAWTARAISARSVATSRRRSSGTTGGAAARAVASPRGRPRVAQVSIQAAIPLRTNRAKPTPRPAPVGPPPSTVRRSSS